MRTAKTLALGAAMLFAVALAIHADEAKEVTLKGVIVCSKCVLHETDDCGTAIEVKEGDKTVTYFVKDEGKAAPYHGKFCMAGKKGVSASVTGVVSEEGGRKYITPAKDGVKFGS